MSTHLVHPPGVAALERWGLLDRLEETGCPPVERYSFDFGPVSVGRIAAADRRDLARLRPAPDRPRQAAGRRRGGGGRRGPRGLHGRGDPLRGRRRDRDPRPRQGRGHRHREGDGRDRRRRQAFAAGEGGPAGGLQRAPLADGDVLRLLERPARRRLRDDDPCGESPGLGGAADPRRPHLRPLRVAPRGVRGEPKGHRGQLPRDDGPRRPSSPRGVRSATRESKFIGTAELPGYFRKPFGPGWVLVGDAGYHKNPITAMGINDAFRDAELVAAASRRRVRRGALLR